MASHRHRGSKRVTIKDVAEAAGVSITTVSNVLNDRTEAMAEETLQRILATIRSLNYYPSSVARSLVTNSTATIGVIVSEIETPLFLQALNVIEPIARSADHNILLCTTAHNLEDEPQTVNLLLEKQVDGIIFLTTSTYIENDYLLNLPASAPPMVLVNRASPDHHRFDQISFNNIQGIIDSIDYLVQLGHHRIAHLFGPVDRKSSQERLVGYRQALQKHGLEDQEDYLKMGDHEAGNQRDWEQATLALLALSPRPTAIIGANDIVTATAMRAAQRAGFRVPQDLTLIGIDNQPFCTYLNPALTTIEMPIVEAGKLAIEKLLARIAGRRTATEHLILPCPLIVRESSGPV
jgi:DNA-binding LacI/PurR family transcriptional regulator